MTIDDKMRDEKLQYNINREAATILASSSAKVDKYEYPIGKEILSSNQQRMIKFRLLTLLEERFSEST